MDTKDTFWKFALLILLIISSLIFFFNENLEFNIIIFLSFLKSLIVAISEMIFKVAYNFKFPLFARLIEAIGKNDLYYKARGRKCH